IALPSQTHEKHGKSGTSFSATRLRSQMRVTITGTCQGVLVFLYGSYLLLDGFTNEFSEEFKFDRMTSYTVTTLFISGTTLSCSITPVFFMTTCAWLNFYFYLQIVSSRCALIQWARTIIKCTIVAIDGFITLLARLATETAPNLLLNECDFQLNLTFTMDHATEMYNRISFYIMMSHYMLILIVMVLSSWSTVSYLHRHMKHVTKSGTSFSSQRLRVPITGICHFIQNLHHSHGDTLGLGQTVFRERIIDICKAFNLLTPTLTKYYDSKYRPTADNETHMCNVW
uniref:Uncharacterized protein n=1 Tax=Neogobius melanostomus TaxID=47308 RepID=A0A8C6T8P0_9GOBI